MEHCETEYGMTGCVYPRRQNTSDAQTLSTDRCLQITCTDTTPECVPTRATDSELGINYLNGEKDILMKEVIIFFTDKDYSIVSFVLRGQGAVQVTQHVSRGAYSSSLSCIRSCRNGNLRYCRIMKDKIYHLSISRM